MAEIYNDEDIIGTLAGVDIPCDDDTYPVGVEPILNDPTPSPLSDDTLGDTTGEIENVPVLPEIEYTINNYLGTIQESVVSIWKYHLSTNKHYIHVELDTLYHQMLDYVDSVIEQYQGVIVGIVPATDYVNVLNVAEYDYLTYLQALRQFVIIGRKKVFSEELTEIWSTIDDIISALDSTIYKLSAFKEEPILTFEAYCYEMEHNKLNENCGHCKNCDDDNEEEEEE